MASMEPATDMAAMNVSTCPAGTASVADPINFTSAPPSHPRRQQNAATTNTVVAIVAPNNKLLSNTRAPKPTNASKTETPFGTVRATIS